MRMAGSRIRTAMPRGDRLFGKPKSQVIKHPGAFRAQAKRAGMSTKAFASHVLANKGRFSGTTVKRASLARTMMSW